MLPKFQNGWNTLGQSLEGRDIRAFSHLIENAKPWALILGGIHGDERATVPFVASFIQDLLKNADGIGSLIAIPLVNPDGYNRDSRYNARGVDLNRNFPTQWQFSGEEPSGIEALSEPESKLLHQLIEKGRPSRIISLHWALSEIDPDGKQSVELARGMWQALSNQQRSLFRLKETAGKPLPGSLGNHCGHNPEGPLSATVTLELPYHSEPSLENLPEDHLETVRILWQTERERYWNTVFPAVNSMLRFAAGN